MGADAIARSNSSSSGVYVGSISSDAKQKLVTGWRSFEQCVPMRWLLIQATPLVSKADAEAALKAAPSLLLANMRAEVTVISTEEVEPVSLERRIASRAREQTTNGPRGPGVALYAGFVVGSAVGVSASWRPPGLRAAGAGWRCETSLNCRQTDSDPSRWRENRQPSYTLPVTFLLRSWPGWEN